MCCQPQANGHFTALRPIRTLRYAHSRLATARCWHKGSPQTGRSLVPSRRASTQAVPNDVKDVAILGGGITGLAAAHYLTEELPDAKVTIYEKADRLGGWMRSDVIDTDDGKIIFESGPRSLRPDGPNGFLALQLVRDPETNL